MDLEIKKNFLTPNEYSRPQIKLDKVNGVVVHYVGNAGSTAIANRNYFEGNKDRKVYSSSHYIIGLDGEIIQCIPEIEIAYCSNNRNKDTISIECCHEKSDGKFNEKTLNSLKELLIDLIRRYSLSSEDIIRHFDVTGKKCPLYFVNNPEEWINFKNGLFEIKKDILDELMELGLISDKTYWSKALGEIKHLDVLLGNALIKIKDKQKELDSLDLNKSIEILVDEGIIVDKKYWTVRGNNYKNLDKLFINIIKKI